MNNKKITFKLGFLQTYYLATPLFVLTDIFWNINVRIPFLNYVPLLKYLYYGLSFSCGLYIFSRPRHATQVGLIESSSNFIILILSFWMTLFSFIEKTQSEGIPVNPFTYQAVISMILSGTIFLTCFYKNPLIMKASRRS